ncbi:short chain dehydrogenase [Plesiocystis pacifica SIR-1]|uniref:Short chain dehydrogenase n=1 Tax=Plesiocystis pacifica SIR-1 TaxID=391625 RepID=A6GFU2_9BACT|nr:SDR family NAD(P)-dependent oxidoreductase [Plesiocystis pacifica]EDM75240.1 short chain dehydrogenase [Plesiocystis pacifica SIR-1]
MRSFDAKVIAITGGAGGIGAALARAFAAKGAHLALLDLDAEAAERTAEGLRQGGARCSAHAVDVSDRGALERGRDEVLREHGGVDVLINNAGLTVFSTFEELSQEEIDRILDVNLRAVIDGCKLFMPALRERPEAHIVNIASSASYVGMPWQTLYSATKFAVRGFSMALRAELATSPIGVTCVCPGATATNIINAAPSRDAAVTDPLAKQMQNAFPPDRLAKRVVRAVRRDRAILPITPDGHAFAIGSHLSPRLMRASMKALAKYGWRRNQ